MNIFQKIFSSKEGKKALPSIPGPVAGKFVEVNGTITWMPDDFNSYVVNGYQANDIIYSIINMIMEKIKVAPWGLYKVVDEGSLKKYHGYLEAKDWMNARRMHKKALEPLTTFDRQSGRVNELLKFPNEEDTFNELVAAAAGYINIVGNNYMWANILAAGANGGLPGELWNTPAQYMAIKATQGFPQRVTGYQLNGGMIKTFTKEEIMHEKLFNPAFNVNGNSLYGQSPIKAAIKTLTRNSASKKAGSTQLDNNGAAGIAFVDDQLASTSPETRETQVNSVKSVWAKEYTGAGNYGKVAFSGYKMGYVQVGLSLKEMALTEIEEVDLRILCNIWGLPSSLLNDAANKTYNTSKEAEKALTSRCALPRLISTRNNINRKLQSDWGMKGSQIYVDFDMSCYDELQENQAEKWAWVNQLPASSKYKMEMMGLDAEDDPNMETILINNQLIPLADVVGGMSDAELAKVNDSLNKAGLTDYLRIAK